MSTDHTDRLRPISECSVAGRVTAAPKTRLAWLDLYRGIAGLVMIEAHVANTFLATTDWPVKWRVALDYANGLVAPAFLFIAGYAHGCGVRRRRSVRTHPGRRLLRLAGIAVLGYALHFPWKELFAGQWAEAVAVGTRMDILPCLAASVATLVLIDRIGHRAAKPVVFVLMAAAIVATPMLADWSAGPAPIIAIVNQNSGSLFPLFPWAAFVFAGFLSSGCAASLRGFMPLMAATIAMSLLLRSGSAAPAGAAFFFERLAWIVVLAPVCGWAAHRWSPAGVLFAGRESLAIYVAHLLLIPPLVVCGLPRMPLAPACALFSGILAATFGIAWGWRRLAGKMRRAA